MCFFAGTGFSEAPEALQALLFGSPRGTSNESFCSNRVFRGPSGTSGAFFSLEQCHCVPTSPPSLSKMMKQKQNTISFRQKLFRRRKIKNCKSLEVTLQMRFDEVSRRFDPCSHSSWSPGRDSTSVKKCSRCRKSFGTNN